MSTRVGTLQGTSAGRSIWPAAVLASLVMLTIAVTAISINLDEGRPGAQTFVGRQVVNTPSELSGGIVGGTAANELGITAGSSSISVAATKAVQTAIIAARNAADTDPGELSGGTAGNTPSELSGGMFERYGLHQRI